MRGKPVSASSVILSRVMHPNDASFMGTVHGGVILRMLDEAGGMAAFRHARRPVVTAAIDRMSFLAPVYVGNLVTAKASVNSVGKTSMEVGVRVEAENLLTGKLTHTASAYLVYVAVGRRGKPLQVPPLVASTAEERRRMTAAELRRKARAARRMAGQRGR
ncbi:MAG: acyl-CoA thioesterase [Candidatus Methylomirabilales bacterium]